MWALLVDTPLCVSSICDDGVVEMTSEVSPKYGASSVLSPMYASSDLKSWIAKI